jgi:hypothetical protein
LSILTIFFYFVATLFGVEKHYEEREICPFQFQNWKKKINSFHQSGSRHPMFLITIIVTDRMKINENSSDFFRSMSWRIFIVSFSPITSISSLHAKKKKRDYFASARK